MIETLMKQAPVVKHPKKEKRKSIHDVIIEQQTKLRLEKQTKKDLSKLTIF